MTGKEISHYRILEELGRGGMGVVYKAHDTKLDRDVALKFLPANLDASPEELARFEQEARAISALNHPGIATIFDFEECGGQRFLALEYIAGGTLKSKLKQLKSEDRQFSIADVVEYGIQIAEALDHAHRHGIVHRDVKTENMMLSEEGRIKLTDFGLAKLRRGVEVTTQGTTMGTAAYMSPEQVRGETIDNRSDIFSFGIVLYELAAMRLPFRADYEAALSFSILNETPVPVTSLRPDAPKELQKIIARCLEKDKTRRYDDLAVVVAELKKVKQVLTGTTPTATRQTWLPYSLAAVGVVMAIVAVYFLLRPPRPTGLNRNTVAVLPFTNLAGDKEEEYFSDGITEDILTQLTKIANLNVISRTSVMQFKGTTKSIREIGRELNAGVILEGSVRHSGDQVRIVAQLIDAADDRHLWAETYDRQYKQILAVQSEIAQHIAAALKIQLSPVEAAGLAASLETNTTAYNLFLQGRYFANRRDGPNSAKGIDFYRRALAIDSSDARVWAALSDAYFQLANTAWGGIQDPTTRAREAALRAIALNDKEAEGHRAYALILHVNDWDWQGADREFKRALALEPGNVAAVYQMSYLSASLGEFGEAIRLGERAIALDPILDRNYFALAFTYHYANRHRESIALSRKTLELNPQYPCAHDLLAMNYLALGKVDSAVAEAGLEGTEVWRLHALALACHAAGRKQEANEALAELIRKYREYGPFQIAEVYGYRGEVDRAFEWLETAFRLRDGGVSQILGDPQLIKIEHDLRYTAFLRKLKLRN